MRIKKSSPGALAAFGLHVMLCAILLFSEFAQWRTGKGKNTSNIFVFKKENQTHAGQHLKWGGERNNNIAAGFVETTCLFTVILDNT